MSDRIADRLLVITHRKNGLRPGAIVKRTGFKYNFVIRWWHRNSPTDSARSGRPRKVTPQVEKRIHRLLEKDDASSTTVGQQVGLSPRTVSSVGKKAGFKPYHRPRRAILTDAHKERRLAFAKKYKHHPWSRTVFGDEKWFTLHPRGNSKNDISWRKRRQDVAPREQKAHAKQVMYWGAISHNGTLPLVEVKGTMDAKQYVRIIGKYLRPYARKRLGRRRWWYLQDSASPHTAAYTKAYFKRHKINYIPSADWPANSPDANPIENLWSVVDARVRARHATTLRGLKQIVQREWKAISVAECRTLVNSESKRLADIRLARGGHTDY